MNTSPGPNPTTILTLSNLANCGDVTRVLSAGGTINEVRPPPIGDEGGGGVRGLMCPLLSAFVHPQMRGAHGTQSKMRGNDVSSA